MRDRQATLIADDFFFLEAPKWRDGKIWTSDAHDCKVYTVTPDGTSRKLCDVPGNPAGLGFLSDGSLIIASQRDRRLLRWKDGRTTTHADLSSATPYELNDFAIDAQDRIYVGNFGYDFRGGGAPKATVLHRVDPDGRIAVAAEDVEFPNAAAIIDGGRRLVVNETFSGRVTAFDMAPDGTLGSRRPFADLSGRGPDGMCADAEGALWIGCYLSGEVLRVKEGGEITDRFKFDGAGISCCLGGEDGKTLIMSTFVGPADEIEKSELRGSRLYSARVEVGAA